MLKGQLITDRLVILLEEKISLMLDCNYYLGKIDYEMELEFPERKQSIAKRYLEELENKLFKTKMPSKEYKASFRSKSERFFHEQVLYSKPEFNF